jgi:MFS family permease
MDTGTIVVSLTWGIGTVALLGVVFSRRYWQWRRHRDRRSIRELLVAVALLIAGLASLMSILVVVIPLGDIYGRRFFAGLAWGAFSAVAALLALWTPRTDG